jgi:DNA-binding transcriptional LysR family regulator
VVARVGHPLADSVSLRELLAAEWVAPGNGETDRATVEALFSGFGLNPPRRMMLGESITMALGLVGQMDLVGLFVEPLVERSFEHHGIRRVDVQEDLPTIQVCVIKLRDHRLTPAAQQLVECVELAASAARSVSQT